MHPMHLVVGGLIGFTLVLIVGALSAMVLLAIGVLRDWDHD